MKCPCFSKLGARPHITFPESALFFFPHGDTETHLPSPNYTQHCHKASLSDDVNVVSRKDSTKMRDSAYKWRPRRNWSRCRKQDSPPFPFLTRGVNSRMSSRTVQGKWVRNNQNQSQTHFLASPAHTQAPALPRKFVQQADGSERECRNGAALLDHRETKVRGTRKRDCRGAVAY